MISADEIVKNVSNISLNLDTCDMGNIFAEHHPETRHTPPRDEHGYGRGLAGGQG